MPEQKMFYVSNGLSTMWAVDQCGLTMLCNADSRLDVKRTPFSLDTAKTVAARFSKGYQTEIKVVHFNDNGAMFIDFVSKP